MRHKRGSKTCLSPVETSCDRIRLILNSSVVLRIIIIFTILYSEILTSEVIVGEDEISPSNADGGMAGRKPAFPAHGSCSHASGGGTNCRLRFPRSVGPGRPALEKFAAPAPLKKFASGCRRLSTCDKAAPAPAVMLHLRSRYVSKAAILTVPAQPCRPKIEVPLEFQGLGSLGAASWRRFFPCEFDSNKERARGCRRSVRFGSVRSLRNGLVRTGAR